MLTPATFRTQMPPFASPANYPDTQVQFYIDLAYKLLNADRWADVLDYGASLFVAHNLAVDALGVKSSTSGVPGTAIGVISSGSVDKVSYTRDINSVTEDGAGNYNMTTFGQRFIRLARMIGAGPLQVGVDVTGVQSASLYSGAWPGPYGGP